MDSSVQRPENDKQFSAQETSTPTLLTPKTKAPSSTDLLAAGEIELAHGTPTIIISEDSVSNHHNDEEVAEELMLNNIAPASAQQNYRTEPSNNIHVWQAKKGADLKSTLEEWGAEENIPVLWDTEEKYSLDYDTFISGTFENAVEVLLSKSLKSAPEYTLSDMPYRLYIGEES